MKNLLFQGVCTALVTPFENGRLNLSMLHRLLDRQLEAGIPAIVISGTTGESPTLTDAEKRTLFRSAKQWVGDSAKILAGTGSNCTERAVQLSMAAQEDGADGLLVVTPYYNKATVQGLVEHYSAIARSVSIPVILYNVPSRTGVDLPADLCLALSEHPNIVGIKEASSDLKKVIHMRALCPPDFAVWSGSDDLVLPMVALGAQGVISVTSNLMPNAMKAMTDRALSGDWTAAKRDFQRLLPLMEALFAEVNPIPVKAAMKEIGLDCGSCRLPLSEPGTACLQRVKKELRALETSEPQSL